MEAPTPLARLTELRLGEPLHGWLGARRRAGDSWRTIAATLQTRTGEPVTDVTVASWFPDLREQNTAHEKRTPPGLSARHPT